MTSSSLQKKITTLLLISIASLSFVFGAGTIRGRVSDANDNPLPFANVVITHQLINGKEIPLKSQLGTVTDQEGYYSLTIMQEGTFLVEIMYLGYQNKTVKVEVQGNQDYTYNVVLENKTIDMEEVVITSQARGQLAAINQQLSSIAIKNVVASDRIQQNPDANAAEAIGRLPGISVVRSGGEATDIVIRGMSPSYNTVLLNGVEVPSNKGASRNASIGGISQFSLQGVEVYKSITPDMDANTVSGAVNMLLGTAPSGFHGSVVAQGGYNAQNSDYGNYKLNANISNRFIEDKLGVDLNISEERVNRSTQVLSAGYSIRSNNAVGDEYEPMYLNSIDLVDVTNINKRTSGSLVIDYRFSPKSKIEFSNFFSSSPSDIVNIDKFYNPISGSVGFGMNQNKGGINKMYSGAIKGEHMLGIVKIDYGISYSNTIGESEIRGFGIFNPYGYQDIEADAAFRSLPLSVIIDTAKTESSEENLYNYGMAGPGSDQRDKLEETQYDARLNLEIPFTISDLITGKIKFGGQYKHKERLRDMDVRLYGGPPFHKLISGIQTTDDGIDWAIPWASLNLQNYVAMDEDWIGGEKGDFLQGGYEFGWYPDIDRANHIYEWWQDITSFYYEQGRDVWTPVFGQERMMGFLDPRPSVVNDNNIAEDYYAGYVMSEINIGKNIHFIPGVRYEEIHDDLYGWFLERSLTEGLVVPGHDTTATRSNRFLLPMVHLKVKPLDWFHIQLSYTNTLHRPEFNAIIPFEYLDNALKPFQYAAGVPNLKPEEWTNYDLMFAFHNNKIGLLSINGFYKKVDHMIWHRSWTRVVSDPKVPYFDENESVDVSSWYNHDFPSYVRGLEIEWQTNFWYLPKPFSYFTLTTNYSYINNITTYPYSEVEVVQIGVSDIGRPLFELQRSDSTYTGAMLNQPNHLANISLGFSYKKFDVWLSYQYIGKILTNKAVMEENDHYKSAFYRFGIQGRLELPVKGMDLLFNLANINNIQESHYIVGESRPVFLENYGMTADFGFRFSF